MLHELLFSLSCLLPYCTSQLALCAHLCYKPGRVQVVGRLNCFFIELVVTMNIINSKSPVAANLFDLIQILYNGLHSSCFVAFCHHEIQFTRFGGKESMVVNEEEINAYTC